MNIEQLKTVTRTRWSFLTGIWKHRGTIISLCRMFEAFPAEESDLRERVVKAQNDTAEANHAKEVAQREAQVLNRELLKAQADLSELHEKHAELIRRKEAPEERKARDEIHLVKLELADHQKRLDLERQDHAKTKRQIQTLWRFIAVRHRLDVPSVDGSIRKILREAEQR